MEDKEHEKAKGDIRKKKKEEVNQTLEDLERGEESISHAVEKLINKNKDVDLGNLFGTVKESGLLKGFEENLKRKYKLS
jgi:predicted CopG family antitoxin